MVTNFKRRISHVIDKRSSSQPKRMGSRSILKPSGRKSTGADHLRNNLDQIDPDNLKILSLALRIWEVFTHLLDNHPLKSSAKIWISDSVASKCFFADPFAFFGSPKRAQRMLAIIPSREKLELWLENLQKVMMSMAELKDDNQFKQQGSVEIYHCTFLMIDLLTAWIVYQNSLELEGKKAKRKKSKLSRSHFCAQQDIYQKTLLRAQNLDWGKKSYGWSHITEALVYMKMILNLLKKSS